MPAQAVIPRGATETGNTVRTYPTPAAPTGIPIVTYDTSRERRDKDGRLVQA